MRTNGRPVTNWSDEETDEPLVSDHRNYYKVEKWSRDGQRVERMDFIADNVKGNCGGSKAVSRSRNDL
jgi:hypothetical protein